MKSFNVSLQLKKFSKHCNVTEVSLTLKGVTVLLNHHRNFQPVRVLLAVLLASSCPTVTFSKAAAAALNWSACGSETLPLTTIVLWVKSIQMWFDHCSLLFSCMPNGCRWASLILIIRIRIIICISTFLKNSLQSALHNAKQFRKGHRARFKNKKQLKSKFAEVCLEKWFERRHWLS